MNVENFIDPKEITIKDGDRELNFIISRLPYLGGGRELCTQFVPTATPKMGDYDANERLAKLMFNHIAVVDGERKIVLETKELVANHVPNFIVGFRLEEAMLEHNMGFSLAGKMSGFLSSLTNSVEQLISKILTASQEQSLAQDKPPSES